MRRFWHPIVLAATAAIAWGCATGALAAGAPATGATTGALSVQRGSTQLLRDCRPWVPRGVSFFGRLVPSGWDTDEGTEHAHDRYDAEALRLAQALGADVVRLQIGMPFLDPRSPHFDRSYLGQVQRAVAQARGAGFSVILSMQWQGRTNVKPAETMPGASALRAWREVGPAFSADMGIAFELFNEPASGSPPRAAEWRAWQQGHQQIIDALRGEGVRNLLIADGLNGAQWLEGAPPLADPLAQLAYAVHPYFGLRPPPEGTGRRPLDSFIRAWDGRFGRFAEKHPVIVTEWSHSARHCPSGGETEVTALLDYLAQRRIGVIAYGIDERQNRIVQPARSGRGADALPPWSSYRHRACSDNGAGPGELLHALFEHTAQQARRAEAVSPAACALPRPAPASAPPR